MCSLLFWYFIAILVPIDNQEFIGFFLHCCPFLAVFYSAYSAASYSAISAEYSQAEYFFQIERKSRI